MKLPALPIAALVALLAAGCGSSSAETGASEEPAETAMSSSSTTTAASDGELISAATELEAVCGTLEDMVIMDPTVDVETFGQAWEKIADGQSCELEGAADYGFAWDGFDEEGRSIPLPQYRAAADKPWEGTDDDGHPESRVTLSIANCHEYTKDFDEMDSAGSTRYFAGALAMCPGHPQADQWRDLVERLPQIEKEEKASQEESIAEKDAEAEAEKKKQAEVAEANKNFADDGSHDIVGTTLNPGLYRSFGPVKDCYWEIADSAGNIIDNNFISTAVQFDVYIPATAGTFTINGCSMKLVGD